VISCMQCNCKLVSLHNSTTFLDFSINWSGLAVVLPFPPQLVHFDYQQGINVWNCGWILSYHLLIWKA
jgi:hypothetical protein